MVWTPAFLLLLCLPAVPAPVAIVRYGAAVKNLGKSDAIVGLLEPVVLNRAHPFPRLHIRKHRPHKHENLVLEATLNVGAEEELQLVRGSEARKLTIYSSQLQPGIEDTTMSPGFPGWIVLERSKGGRFAGKGKKGEQVKLKVYNNDGELSKSADGAEVVPDELRLFRVVRRTVPAGHEVVFGPFPDSQELTLGVLQQADPKRLSTMDDFKTFRLPQLLSAGNPQGFGDGYAGVNQGTAQQAVEVTVAEMPRSGDD